MSAPEPTQSLRESLKGIAMCTAILCGQIMAVWGVLNWSGRHEKEKPRGRER